MLAAGTATDRERVGYNPLPAGRGSTMHRNPPIRVAADGRAEFEQTLSTKMACLQPAGGMHVERGVFNAFRNTAKVAIVDGKLVMLDATGNALAKLVQTASP